MASGIRTLSLTNSHVAFIHRVVPETPPSPSLGLRRCNDDDFAGWTTEFLTQDPDPDGPLRLFVYGSLIWKPEIAHETEEAALLRGWHRSFCLTMPGFRGTPEFPGLMMALDRGGACSGLVLTLGKGDKREQIDRMLRREMPYTPPGNLPLWVRPHTSRGPIPALAFIANRQSPRYAGRQSADRVAEVLARACGYGGTGAEYLLQTVSHFEARGIRDSMLWRLQAMVAERIEAAMRS